MNITLKLHQVVAVPVVRYFVALTCLNLAMVVPADTSLGRLVVAEAVRLGPVVVVAEVVVMAVAVGLRQATVVAEVVAAGLGAAEAKVMVVATGLGLAVVAVKAAVMAVDLGLA